MSTEHYARIRGTQTFRENGFAAWRKARLGIIGCGAIGSRLAPEAVRSGADVWLCDFEHAEPHNLANQAVRAGVPKVDSVMHECESIRSGSAAGVCGDVRHVGVGVFRSCSVLIDATDDRRLGYVLTTIANGLSIPLLRVAVDGSGQWELGRVLCSDLRDGGACQLCSYSLDDVLRQGRRTPCPGQTVNERPATRAGGPLAAAVAGLALIQAQRLVTGNDLELVRDREVIVDFSHMQIMAGRLMRSQECLSGHVSWEIVDLPSAQYRRLGDVMTEAERRLGTDEFQLEPFGHPLCLEAACRCGAQRLATGTIWAPGPTCRSCGSRMVWSHQTQRLSLTPRQSAELGIMNRTLDALGFPEQGAMFVARADDRPTVHLILN